MSLRTTSVILCGVAFAALLTLQFLPWANYEQEGGSTPGATYMGFTMPGTSWPDSEVRATTWNLEMSMGGSERDEGWYSNDLEDDDGDDAGLTMLRSAIPLLLVALAGFAAAGLLLLLVRGPLGSIVALSSGVVLLVATVLFANGVDEVFDGVDYTWLAGLYVAIAACVVGLVGGTLGLVARNDEPRVATA
jgi:hypothetical protein